MLGVIGGEFDPDHRAQQIKSLGDRLLVHSDGDNGATKHYDLESFQESPPRHLR